MRMHFCTEIVRKCKFVILVSGTSFDLTVKCRARIPKKYYCVSMLPLFLSFCPFVLLSVCMFAYLACLSLSLSLKLLPFFGQFVLVIESLTVFVRQTVTDPDSGYGCSPEPSSDLNI